MTNRPDPITILAPQSFRRALSRRSFLQLGGAGQQAWRILRCLWQR